MTALGNSPVFETLFTQWTTNQPLIWVVHSADMFEFWICMDMHECSHFYSTAAVELSLIKAHSLGSSGSAQQLITEFCLDWEAPRCKLKELGGKYYKVLCLYF